MRKSAGVLAVHRAFSIEERGEIMAIWDASLGSYSEHVPYSERAHFLLVAVHDEFFLPFFYDEIIEHIANSGLNCKCIEKGLSMESRDEVKAEKISDVSDKNTARKDMLLNWLTTVGRLPSFTLQAMPGDA